MYVSVIIIRRPPGGENTSLQRSPEKPTNPAVPPHPSALFFRAVGMAVQAGEDCPWWHGLAGLIPAVRVTQTSGVSLALPIQDGVQPVVGVGNKYIPASSTTFYLKPNTAISELYWNRDHVTKTAELK